MFKLIGMIVGAGLMLLAGIAWLDAPEAKKVSSQIHNEIDQVIDKIEEEARQAQIAEENSPAPESELEPESELATASESQPEPVESNHVSEAEPVNDNIQSVDESVQPETVNSNWHIFWKPFSSSKSADGFAKRLSQQSGVEISVISNRQGEHVIAFSYTDEADKQRKLQLIKEKTGLEVIQS